MSGQYDLVEHKRAGIPVQSTRSAAGVDLTFAALYGLRDQIAAIAEPIAELLSERRRVIAKQAHTDDLVAAYRSAIEAAAADYEALVAMFLSGRQLDGDALKAVGTGAACYFMRDLIAGKAPALIERLYPEAKAGLKEADRRAALVPIESRLRALSSQRDGLAKALSAERSRLRALLNGQVYVMRDRVGRAAIETQMLDLPAEIDRVTRDQEALGRELSSTGTSRP